MPTDAHRDRSRAPPLEIAASDATGRRVLQAVTCPFCGLACDDLEVEVSGADVRVVANGCERSTRLFRESLPRSPAAAIAGEAATLDAAVGRAAAILGDAVQPVIGGLATDVAGVRAVLDLADRLGAVVDHLGSRAFMRNVLTQQESGSITTTFAEVRNRADLIVVAGTDVISRFPRFFERVAFGEAMFTSDAERDVVFVGARAAVAAATPRAGRAPRIIECENRRLGDVFGALRALIGGTLLPAQARVGGVALPVLQELAQRMREARYGVLVWAAADLDFPHAAIAVEAMYACVRALNEHTRFAALPLGGNDADTTANQVCLWQTGFPLRVSFAGGVIDYDPYRYAAEDALASGGGDALLWIASFDSERTPPPTEVPTIVLRRSGPPLSRPPAVELTVATPGLDHAGHFYRGDGVVALRLRQLVDSPLPSVADVITRIRSKL
jgi:formylmethanofuran dehydrogenase subunit B